MGISLSNGERNDQVKVVTFLGTQVTVHVRKRESGAPA